MTPDEAIEQARWYEREDIATTLRESANVLADECERLRERVKVLEDALRPWAKGYTTKHPLDVIEAARAALKGSE